MKSICCGPSVLWSCNGSLNPVALKTARTPLSLGRSECNRVNVFPQHLFKWRTKKKISLNYFQLSFLPEVMGYAGFQWTKTNQHHVPQMAGRETAESKLICVVTDSRRVSSVQKHITYVQSAKDGKYFLYFRCDLECLTF